MLITSYTLVVNRFSWFILGWNG